MTNFSTSNQSSSVEVSCQLALGKPSLEVSCYLLATKPITEVTFHHLLKEGCFRFIDSFCFSHPFCLFRTKTNRLEFERDLFKLKGSDVGFHGFMGTEYVSILVLLASLFIASMFLNLRATLLLSFDSVHLPPLIFEPHFITDSDCIAFVSFQSVCTSDSI